MGPVGPQGPKGDPPDLSMYYTKAEVDALIASLRGTPIFNTGVDGGGEALALGSVDPHWQIISGTDPTQRGQHLGSA